MPDVYEATRSQQSGITYDPVTFSKVSEYGTLSAPHSVVKVASDQPLVCCASHDAFTYTSYAVLALRPLITQKVSVTFCKVPSDSTSKPASPYFTIQAVSSPPRVHEAVNPASVLLVATIAETGRHTL